MIYKQLGTSSLRISEIGFGCMSLAGNDKENSIIIHAAIESGINFFDTADLYNKGMNESSVGNAIKGKREKIVLATKVGNQWKPDGSGWYWNPKKQYILASVEESLKRLQTDHIDLYQLHGGTIDDPIDETIEAFELLRQQGKILEYGISSIRPNVIREYVNRSHIVSVMMQYSMLDRRPEESCLDLLHSNNISVLARGGLAQGLLVNKSPNDYLNYKKEEVKKAAGVIKSFSSKKRTAAQTAIRFVLHHPAIFSAVIGVRTIKQLKEIVGTGSAPELTDEEINQLRNAVPVNVYEEHR